MNPGGMLAPADAPSRVAFLFFVAICASVAAAEAAASPAASEPPRPSGLIERVETRLVQLDVMVEGKSDDLYRLSAADFELLVGGTSISNLIVDRICPQGQPAPPTDVARAPTSTGDKPTPGPAITFVFFFDQPHLTFPGRARAIELTRELIPRLVTGKNRGMIVSSAAEMATIVPLTQDTAFLLQGLDRLEKDLRQWDPYAEAEVTRIVDVVRAIEFCGAQCARNLARAYRNEEWWQARRSLHRLGIVLGSLAEVEPPKAVLYFADNMRQNAGLHYLQLAPDDLTKAEEMLPEAAFEFDRLIQIANTFGVHLYPIQAEGLVASHGGVTAQTRAAIPATERIRHAEGSLVTLALETGGDAFLRGVPPAKIADRLIGRLGCLYRLSFDPADLPKDTALSVAVRVLRPGIRARAQTSLIVQSDAERTRSRLLAAFTVPEAQGRGSGLVVELIPLGFERGRYRALVQVRIPTDSSRPGDWDLGASLLGSGRVRGEFSARIGAKASGLPMVLEREFELEPGPFEIVAVAYHVQDRVILSERKHGVWPEPPEEGAVVAWLALLQERTAGFSRNGEVRSSGTIALSENEPVWIDRPTAVMAMVCRGRRGKGDVNVVRELVGETAVPFGNQALEDGEDGCALFRDLIPAGSMSPGEFTYQIKVVHNNQDFDKLARSFVALDRSPEPYHSAR